jgi:hypothetical protein
MNNYAKNCYDYRSKKLSVIPDKFMSKQPAIKGWSDYCYKLPEANEMEQWSNLKDSNIALALGEASGVIALDFDCVDPEIIKLVENVLPQSSVEKKGAKGWTRFFKYTGEHTQALKYNGQVVFEVLSSGKKTTLPPSIHPNGEPYVWTTEKTLLEVDVDDLPILPPYLFQHTEQMLRMLGQPIDNTNKGLVNGRNNELSGICARLIDEKVPVGEAVRELVKTDKKLNNPALFSDANEFRHTEAFTNALQFYVNHLQSYNSKRYRENKEYEIPVIPETIEEHMKETYILGKSTRLGDPKKLSQDIPFAAGVMGDFQTWVLKNSFIEQPMLALSASISLMSALVSRKIIFNDLSPNTYVLNISPSGSGKDAPQQHVKQALIAIKRQDLLGSGDYVSDASLMDSLGTAPVRLDIIDEASGLLKGVSSGNQHFNGKMSDVLCELYTSSNNLFLGRATAEGTKGQCYRPNVNLLCSTTPAGFSQSLSRLAIEKGLLGRFLLFFGDAQKKAKRVKKMAELTPTAVQYMKWWADYEPEDRQKKLGQISQKYTSLQANEEANKELDVVFEKFDSLRIKTEENDARLPVIARLYQQVVKLSILHACSRAKMEVPTIQKQDVEWAHAVVNYYFAVMSDAIDNYIFDSESERKIIKILSIIDKAGEISAKLLRKKTRFVKRKEREEILAELQGDGYIEAIRDKDGTLNYRMIYANRD